MRPKNTVCKGVNFMKLAADWGDIRINALENKSVESTQDQKWGGKRVENVTVLQRPVGQNKMV